MESKLLVVESHANPQTLRKWAAAGVGGLVLVGLNTFFMWAEGLAVLGFAITAVSIGMVIMTHEGARKVGIKARLDDEGYRVASSKTAIAGKWREVSRIVYRDNTITLHKKDQQNFSLVPPPGYAQEQMDGLAAEFRAHFDASRR